MCGPSQAPAAIITWNPSLRRRHRYLLPLSTLSATSSKLLMSTFQSQPVMPAARAPQMSLRLRARVHDVYHADQNEKGTGFCCLLTLKGCRQAVHKASGFQN